MGLISILLCKVRHTSVLFRWVLELVRSLFYHAVWCFWPHRAQRSLNYSRVTRSPAFVPFGTSDAVFCDPRLVPWDDLASPWPPLLRRELFPSQLPALRLLSAVPSTGFISVPPTATSKRPCTRQFFTDYLHVADSPLSALLLLQLPLASARRACAFYSLRLYLQFYLFISFDWIAGNFLKSILMLNNSLFMYVCYLTHSLIF